MVTSGSSIIDYELFFGFIHYEISGELGVEIFWVFELRVLSGISIGIFCTRTSN